MYTYILFAHSWIRWVVLILAFVNLYNSYRGWRGIKDYTPADQKLSRSFVSVIHLQGTLGLILYFFFSPFAFSSFLGEMDVMKNSLLRFWSIEHIFAMILAITFITIGSVKVRKEYESKLKFKKQLIYFSIGIILILTALPYQEAGRWFRFL